MNVKGGFFNGDEAPFCEDIYLLDADGISIARREAKKSKVFSLYDMIDMQESDFISNNRAFPCEHKLLLIITLDGRPILIDCIFYSRYQMLTAIVPRFKIGVLKSLIEEGLGDQLVISPKASAALAECKKLAFSESEWEFAQRISRSHPISAGYDTDHMDNQELVNTVLALTCNYSKLYGCAVNAIAFWDGEFDMNGYFSPYAYGFVLAALCLLARKYSEDCSMNVRLNLSNGGIYCDFEFWVHKKFRNRDVFKDYMFPHLNAICFLNRTYMDFMDKDIPSGHVKMRLSPLKNIPESSDIKQKIKKLQY